MTAAVIMVVATACDTPDAEPASVAPPDIPEADVQAHVAEPQRIADDTVTNIDAIATAAWTPMG